MAVICETADETAVCITDKSKHCFWKTRLRYVHQYWHDIHHQAHGCHKLVLLEGLLKTSSLSLRIIMTFKVGQ